MRKHLEEIIGAVMLVAPDEFMPCLQPCAKRLGEWLSRPDDKVLGLYFACDIIENLRNHAGDLLYSLVYPVCMEEIYKSLTDADAAVRTAAAYAVNCAAPMPNFAVLAPKAFHAILNIVMTAKPKKKDEKAKDALDNAVAALFFLAKEQGAQCPPEIPIQDVWSLVVSKLPLKADTAEGKKVHNVLVDLVLAEHPHVVAIIEMVLSVLAEIYKTETFAEKETNIKIVQIFKSINSAALVQMGEKFSDKQKKKIDKILRA